MAQVRCTKKPQVSLFIIWKTFISKIFEAANKFEKGKFSK